MRELLRHNQCVLQIESSKDRLPMLEKALGARFSESGSLSSIAISVIFEPRAVGTECYFGDGFAQMSALSIYVRSH